MESRARKWASRRIDLREDGFEVGKLLIDRGKQLLSLPIAKKRIEKTIEVNGQQIETVTYLEFREHPRDGMNYIKEGVKLQRLSADMSTENLNLKPEDLDADLDSMTEEELLAYASKFEEIRQAEIEAGNV